MVGKGKIMEKIVAKQLGVITMSDSEVAIPLRQVWRRLPRYRSQ